MRQGFGGGRSSFDDKTGGGTGLGAYSAKLIAGTLGGSITLDSSKKDHTGILVKLPGPE